jgi:hypothetical protein
MSAGGARELRARRVINVESRRKGMIEGVVRGREVQEVSSFVFYTVVVQR